MSAESQSQTPKEPSKIPISRQTINKMHWPTQTEREKGEREGEERKKKGERKKERKRERRRGREKDGESGCRCQTDACAVWCLCVAIIMRKLTMQLAL